MRTNSSVDLRGENIACSGIIQDTQRRIDVALKSLAPVRAFDVLFYSPRKEFFYVPGIAGISSELINSITFCSSPGEVARTDGKYDIAIICTHIMKEHLAQHVIRLRRMASVIVLWNWDNHHHYYENVSYNSLADIVLPAHGFCASAIKSPNYLLGQQVPLCTAQWSTDLVADILQDLRNTERSSSLYGGFIMWPNSARSDHLLELQREIPNNRLRLISVEDRGEYFFMSPEDQVRDWARHRVSLNLPYSGDLSLRVFDSLLTGVIPIVPRDCQDLDNVIPVELQKSLPILRFDEFSVPAVTEIWREGLARFNRMGYEGVLGRHVYARDHHHVSARIQQIVSYIAHLDMSHGIEISIDNAGIGLVACPCD